MDVNVIILNEKSSHTGVATFNYVYFSLCLQLGMCL